MRNVDLPYGDTFSPGALNSPSQSKCELAIILEIGENSTSPQDLEKKIMNQFGKSQSLAANSRRSIASYGIITAPQDTTLTELGEELYVIRNDTDNLYNRFAEHILLHLHGLSVLEIISDLQAEGKSTNDESLIPAINNRTGLYAGTPSGNYWNYMRKWLQEADVLDGKGNNYSISWKKVAELTGAPRSELGVLKDLTYTQRAFLLTLARLNPSGPVDPSQIRSIAEVVFEIQFPHKQFANEVLEPLSDEDFIDYVKGGRGAGEIELTDRLEAEVIAPLIEIIARRKDIPQSILRATYDDIFEEIDNDDHNVRGEALEKLAIKIGRLLGLEFRGWQTRGPDTGYSEVDVVFDSATTHFDRWQIQCKNPSDRSGAGITNSTVAREAGIAQRLQSNVLLMITTGNVSGNARAFARQLMSITNLTIIFLDRTDLEEFDGDPGGLVDSLEDQTMEIRQMRSLGTRDLSEPYGRADTNFSDRSEQLEEMIRSITDED